LPFRSQPFHNLKKKLPVKEVRSPKPFSFPARKKNNMNHFSQETSRAVMNAMASNGAASVAVGVNVPVATNAARSEDAIHRVMAAASTGSQGCFRCFRELSCTLTLNKKPCKKEKNGLRLFVLL